MRKYELATVLFVSALARFSSIVATVYGVYPFGEFRPWSEWAVVVTGDYSERQDHHSTRQRRHPVHFPLFLVSRTGGPAQYRVGKVGTILRCTPQQLYAPEAAQRSELPHAGGLTGSV